MTRKMFDERRGVKRYKFLCCRLNSKAEENIVLEALEREGYIWGYTRDNPTKHHYNTPYCIAAICSGTIGCVTNIGTPVSVGEFLDKLPLMDWRYDDD